jgi:hypothetical protein
VFHGIDANSRIAPAGCCDTRQTVDVATDRILIGAGRALPRLLFVTNLARLASNLDVDIVARIEASLADSPHTLVDVPDAAPDRLAHVRRCLPGHRGVVILGGYDVLSPVSIDVLPASLRARLSPKAIADERDGFVVWTDDPYSDADGDGIGELPVSRIPDGRSSALVLRALNPATGPLSRRFGVRNVHRPFADPIFHELPGSGSLLTSETTTTADIDPGQLDVDALYLMLHGYEDDGTYFKGERAVGFLTAIDLGTVPAHCGATVFTGCCWGALCGDPRAAVARPNDPLIGRTSTNSLALRFLAAGARAFVGCTGAHQAPFSPPYDYFAGPLHRAFWSIHASGAAPSLALHQAKQVFAHGIPHRFKSDNNEAVELKLLHQFTCLGLGW